MKTLIERKGDLIVALQADHVDFIMHCVNCKGRMNNGVAAEIKEAYPKVFKKYLDFVENATPENLLGYPLVVDRVINIFAQDNDDPTIRQLNYGALTQALMHLTYGSPLLKHFDIGKNLVIGIPKHMCCDRAGGDWEIVSEILQGLPDWIEIWVYER